MNILVLGSGGREHALAWKLRQSKLCSRLLVAPGNAGTSQYGENVSLSITDFEAIRSLCVTEFIEMVIVGPEEPLVKGIYDFFKNHDDLKLITVIGPSAGAAQLEGSKAFSKKFMQRHNIPTAAYAEFDETTYESGKKYISNHSLPVVLKADGLAAGKGVIICETHHEALDAFEQMIIKKQFGEASSKVVIEEFLQGIELSVFVLTDGQQYKVIGHAKDYKRIGEGDTGLNTGGMGCVSPVPFAHEAFMQKVEERIIKPTVQGLSDEKLEYHGFIFIGLMNKDGEPHVIEYNCRLGDPETEVIMPRLKNDLLELLVAVKINQLNNLEIEFDERSVATIVAVSGGYPGEYKKGIEMKGLPDMQPEDKDVLVFHAGTKNIDDLVVTNGGRVLAVTAFGHDIKSAVEKSRKALEDIDFEGIYYRKDIGFEF
ncbi:phosphoribosylamine--glycine ligase [Segetibacter sp.]|jgi:phosphoribosylamine--glycine ligase|uniref:phosphoribosylamine--glycine ligase n=1 Tax=Segetibacter sp. TaxID=2231182 RepID=UPI00261F48BD|nr:phosphoribosylamine--glycine ligase [Segetibacter sp.]MCW3081971.1 phosphoribosylamine-glycine ligase [Segetibacter sp.]